MNLVPSVHRGASLPAPLSEDANSVALPPDSGVTESEQGLLGVNNVLMGGGAGRRQQDTQALLCHMASRLNMGHEGVVHPIVPLWLHI
ncbi:hypothetical protein NQZ68_008720 [Dissostichus eleginoides]|nr:hypothetical protein NQZ68_008720 [Dissostichus eleginoides]